MLKVKIINGNDSDALETAINEFIADKKVVDIKYQALTYISKYNGNGIPIEAWIHDRAMIIYEEENNNDM